MGSVQAPREINAHINWSERKNAEYTPGKINMSEPHYSVCGLAVGILSRPPCKLCIISSTHAVAAQYNLG